MVKQEDKAILCIRAVKNTNALILRWRYNPLYKSIKGVKIYLGETYLETVSYPKTEYVLSTKSLQMGKIYLEAIRTSKVDMTRESLMPTQIFDNEDIYCKAGEVTKQAIIPQQGDPAFFMKEYSQEPFVPNGSNFTRLYGTSKIFDHANFTSEVYDEDEIEYLLSLMKSFNYNVVRVFISGRFPVVYGIAGSSESEAPLDKEYMDNFVDFLKRCIKKGIYVIPTLLYYPINRYFRAYFEEPVVERNEPLITGRENPVILTEGGIKAKTEYISQFLRYIKNKDASLLKGIFSLQIENEEYLNATEGPFKFSSGEIQTADGNKYDMSDPEAREECVFRNGVNYLNAAVKSVKEVAPKLMVSESIFAFTASGVDPEKNFGVMPVPWNHKDPRWPLKLDTLAASDIDYIDFHFYPLHLEEEVWKDQLNRDLSVSGFHQIAEQLKQKPLFLGEYGMFLFVTEDDKKASEALRRIRDVSYEKGFRGWALWTFDSEEQEGLLHGSNNDHRINRALSNYKP